MSFGQNLRASWQKVGTLAWSPERVNPVWVGIKHSAVPDVPGVYAYLTGDAVQKIGKAEGAGGLRSRHAFGRGDTTKNATTALWARVWGDGQLKGVAVDVFFHPLPTVPVIVDVPGFGPKEVQLQAARSLECLLSEAARDEGEPLLLAGAAD